MIVGKNRFERGEKIIDEIIAYCGGVSHTCAIFLATRENNERKDTK